jgi:hypothetical protein
MRFRPIPEGRQEDEDAAEADNAEEEEEEMVVVDGLCFEAVAFFKAMLLSPG